MTVYHFPKPIAPAYKKPTSAEDCLLRARQMVKKEHGRGAMGPVRKGDRLLIVTLPDQDEYVKEAITQALKEAGAEKVDFIYEEKLTGKTLAKLSVEDGWKEAENMAKAPPGTDVLPHIEATAKPLREYLDKHPEYTGVFVGLGGRLLLQFVLREHGRKFRNNWLFNNAEEFMAKTWIYPDELWREIERPAIEAIGQAAKVRITDPEGTYIEYSLSEEEALRWQMCAWLSGHLYLDPLQATSQEASVVPVSSKIPPVFHNLTGVLAGTANHMGFYPRIRLHFEEARLVEVSGGGRYGDIIREMMDRYKEIRWPGYPGKGFFWFCDSALCTGVKSFRRSSDMFGTYWRSPNLPERNRAGVFHHGFGSRRHGEEFTKFSVAHELPRSHIHVHNYFTTYEVQTRGSGHWVKITDKGHLTSLDDPKIRTLAVRFGDPDELLSVEWVPPLPGINCEGDYLKDYAPDPIAYLKKRLKENRSV